MWLADSLLALLAFLGHFAFCVATFNRLHAYGIPRKLRRKLELVLLAWFFAILGCYGSLFISGWSLVATMQQFWSNVKLDSELWRLAYPVWCWLLVAWAIPWWLWPRMIQRDPVCLLENHSQLENVEAKIGPLLTQGRQANILAKIPGNERYHLQTQIKALRIPRLPTALQNLSITHLSDLHFTGDLDQRFYDYVVESANRLAGDVVILSGDIIEAVACEPWIEQTLARLSAPQGKYFVLGNHDRRMPDCTRVRELMQQAGFIDVGGRAQLVTWNSTPVLLVGDERPWFPGPSDEEIERLRDQGFPLLVAHTPDRYPWAQQQKFALMLAGHNHGGQIRFPLIGPLISPSKWGTRYASGVFAEGNTIMHVSRGLSGEHPYRWNCPPELAKLVLKQ